MWDTGSWILKGKIKRSKILLLFGRVENIREKGEKMIEEPIHVTDAAFEKTVMQSTLPVIVDFWAPWCGPCKVIAPMLEKIAKEYAGKLIIAKVNTDENPINAQNNQIQGIPTLLFVSKGKVAHRQVGAVPESNLRMAVDQFLEIANE